MTITPIDIGVFSCPGTPFQSSAWARVKQASGWTAFPFLVGPGGAPVPLLVLVRSLAPCCSLAYVPFGPDVFSCGTAGPWDILADFSRAVRPFLPRTTFVVRYDLPWHWDAPDAVDVPNGAHFRIPPESVQPDGTIRIDLSSGYDGTAANYRSRARRTLKKSAGLIDVVCWDGSPGEFDRWYSLYCETARRDGFSVRPKGYVRSLLAADGAGTGDVACKLLLARRGETLCGGIIVMLSGTEAVYLLGASLRDGGPSSSYALQDTAVRMACERGCLVYDLFGIPGPFGRGMHLSSLELFKRSFGGSAAYRTPTVDYVFRRTVYGVFSAAETIRYRRFRHPRRPADGGHRP